MSTPDSVQPVGTPIPRVSVVTEEHTTSDDDLGRLLRIARSRPRHPGLIVSTTSPRSSRG